MRMVKQVMFAMTRGSKVKNEEWIGEEVIAKVNIIVFSGKGLCNLADRLAHYLAYRTNTEVRHKFYLVRR